MKKHKRRWYTYYPYCVIKEFLTIALTVASVILMIMGIVWIANTITNFILC